MKQERLLNIGLKLNRIGMLLDDRSYETIKPALDVIEQEVGADALEDKELMQNYSRGLDDLLKELEKIDACEFASYTLALIREKAEALKAEEIKKQEAGA